MVDAFVIAITRFQKAPLGQEGIALFGGKLLGDALELGVNACKAVDKLAVDAGIIAAPRSAALGLGDATVTLDQLGQMAAEQPIEILRTIPSFDPCRACAVHLLDGRGTEIIKVRAL